MRLAPPKMMAQILHVVVCQLLEKRKQKGCRSQEIVKFLHPVFFVLHPFSLAQYKRLVQFVRHYFPVGGEFINHIECGGFDSYYLFPDFDNAPP